MNLEIIINIWHPLFNIMCVYIYIYTEINSIIYKFSLIKQNYF